MGKTKKIIKKRKILYISGTRADYGLMRETLLSIKNHPRLKVEIVVTGMHLMPEFGKTIDEIEKDNFKVHQIKAVYKYDNKESMANFIGKFVQLLTRKMKKIKPDMILVLGDRGEMLAGAIIGAYLTIPVAHIHGGDVTSTVDEIARHAITKMANLHFPGTKKSAQKIIKMGEEPRRVFVVGSPNLDDILNKKPISKNQLVERYKLNLSEPILLVLQHPVSDAVKDSGNQMKKTMEAIKELGYQTVVIYPNADAGGRKMIEVIERYRKLPFVQTYKSIPRKEFLILMEIADAMVGNSSSGIIEAPSFHLPVVNIGRRQGGRERAGNTIEVGYNKEQIKKAIKKVIYDKNFKKTLERIKSPYGNGRAGERIAKILSEIKIDKKLLN